MPEAPTVELVAITAADLARIAHGEAPDWHQGPVLDDALPPRFVAERSLRQAGQGVAWRWCSTFHVVRSADRAIVGGCGFKQAPLGGWIEIGYGIAPSCRRQGLARQAVRALLQLAFDSVEVQAVWAEVNPGNLASIRVVQALGFLPDGPVRGPSPEPLLRWVRPRPGATPPGPTAVR